MTPLQQLREAIGVLAAPPEDQLLYLINIGHFDNDPEKINKQTNIDELGLQFEDATYLVPQLLRNGQITPNAERLIKKLDDFTLSLSGSNNAEFWTVNALKEDRRWTQVRDLASECLSEIAITERRNTY